MHSTTYLALGMAAIAPLSVVAFNQSDLTTKAPPGVAASVVSEIRAKLSSQVTGSAFAAEISKVPEAKGHNIPSEIANFAGDVLTAFGTSEPTPPAWLNAVPTDGAVDKAIIADLIGAQLLANPASGMSTSTFVSKGLTTVSSGDSVMTFPAGSTSTSVTTTLSGTSEKTSTSMSTGTSKSTSTGESTTSTGTSKTTSTASSTSTSTGGAASQPICAVMAMGAAAAGILGMAALL